MNSSEREAQFRSVWDRVWHGPDFAEALTEWFTEDFLMHISSVPDPIPRAAWIGFVGNWQNAFPDGRMDIQDLVIRDDQLWVYWISSGTHSNEYLGVPASGNKVNYQGIEIYRYSGDRIAEWRRTPAEGFYQATFTPDGESFLIGYRSGRIRRLPRDPLKLAKQLEIVQYDESRWGPAGERK